MKLFSSELYDLFLSFLLVYSFNLSIYIMLPKFEVNMETYIQIINFTFLRSHKENYVYQTRKIKILEVLCQNKFMNLNFKKL